MLKNGPMRDLTAWQAEHAGSTRDLSTFYERIIAAIRAVDSATPVMVDGGYYANARSLAAWPKRLSDDHVLYAIHMYEPYAAASAPNLKRDAPLRYPGVTTDYAGGKQTWDRTAVANHIGVAFDWAAAQGLKPTRIAVAEFGCMRLWPDCGTHLKDVMDAVDAGDGYWAFYSFREEVWDDSAIQGIPGTRPRPMQCLRTCNRPCSARY
ncbi:cellulase family glycosylhydrolase [Burkholderia ubonensis]|uniref:cellulase family glycosylhydrolase n=1 Tax=Burkholderia ubonensis TaxID=101571 RepID=UPI0018E15741|nr:cellulase family glycosylhydrolase [Burkholderia ubonensis]